MPLADRERRSAERAVDEVMEAVRAAGVSPDGGSGLAASLNNLRHPLDLEALSTQAAATERTIQLGALALGMGTAATWGVDNVLRRMADRRSQVTQIAERARRFHEGVLSLWNAVSPIVEASAHLADIASRAKQAWRDVLPSNLREIEPLSLREVVEFVAEEGIPLYLVPRQSTAMALLRSGSRKQRRAILTSRAGSICMDCREVWAEHTTPATEKWIKLLESGLLAYEEGHVEPAQALFTVVLDSITFALPSCDRRRYTKHATGDVDFEHLLDEESFSTVLAILPLWAVHEANWPAEGHEVPRALNRHAALHRASPRQYSKRNAIQALMLATSLLAWFADYGPSAT